MIALALVFGMMIGGCIGALAVALVVAGREP